jgi:hypothetical protein
MVQLAVVVPVLDDNNFRQRRAGEKCQPLPEFSVGLLFRFKFLRQPFYRKNSLPSKLNRILFFIILLKNTNAAFLPHREPRCKRRRLARSKLISGISECATDDSKLDSVACFFGHRLFPAVSHRRAERDWPESADRVRNARRSAQSDLASACGRPKVRGIYY